MPNITMLDGAGGIGTYRGRSGRHAASSESDSSSGSRLEIVGRGLCKRPVRYSYMPKWTRQTTPSPPLPVLSSDIPNSPSMSAVNNDYKPNPLEVVSFFSDTCSTRSTTPTAKPDSAYYSEYHPDDGTHPAMPRPPIPYRPVGDMHGSMESQLAETGNGGLEGEGSTFTAGGDRQSNSQSSSYGPASDVTDPNHSTSSILSDDGGSSLTDSVEHLYALSPPSFEDFLGFDGDFSESSSYDLNSVENSAIISDYVLHGEGKVDYHGNTINNSAIDNSTEILQSELDLGRPKKQSGLEATVLCRPRIHRGNYNKREGLTDSTGTYIICYVNPKENGYIQSPGNCTEFGRTFHISSPGPASPGVRLSQTHTVTKPKHKGQIRSDTIILEKSTLDINQGKTSGMPAGQFDTTMDKPYDVEKNTESDRMHKQLVSTTTDNQVGNQAMLPALKVTSPPERKEKDDLDSTPRAKGVDNYLNVSSLGSKVGFNAEKPKRIQDLDALADKMATKTLMQKTHEEGREQQETTAVEAQSVVVGDVTSRVKGPRQVAMTTKSTQHGDESTENPPAEVRENQREKQLNTTFVLSSKPTSLKQGRHSAVIDSKPRQDSVKRFSGQMERIDNLDKSAEDFFPIRPSSSTVDFFDQEIPTSARSAPANIANSRTDSPMENFNNNSGEEVGDENVDDPAREEIAAGGNNDTEEGGQGPEGNMIINHVIAVMSHQADGPLIGQDYANRLAVVPAQPEVGDSQNYVLLGLTDEIIAEVLGLYLADATEEMAPTPPPPPQIQHQAIPAVDEVRTPPHVNTVNNNSNIANIQQQNNDNENDPNDQRDNLSEELEAISSDLVSQVIRRAAENEELARTAAVQSSASGAVEASAGPLIPSPSPIIARISDDKSEVGNQYDYEDDFEDEDAEGGRANSSRVSADRRGLTPDNIVSPLEEAERRAVASVCEQESGFNKDRPPGTGMSPGSPKVEGESVSTTSIDPEPTGITKTLEVQPTKAVSGRKRGSDREKAGQHLTPGMKPQTHRTVSRTWRPTTRPTPPGGSAPPPAEQNASGVNRHTTQTRKNSRMSNSLKTSAAAYGVRERRTKKVGSLSTIKREKNPKIDRPSPHPPRTPKLPPVEDPVRTSSESLRRSSPTKTINESTMPALPTFGRPQTIRALGTGARKLRNIEQPEVTPEIKTTMQKEERDEECQSSQGKIISHKNSNTSHKKPWRQGHSRGTSSEGTYHKGTAAMSRRQAQIEFSKRLADRTSAHRKKTRPGLPSVLKSDAYWQNGQLHIRVHGPARLLCPDTSAVEGEEGQLAGSTDESPTVPLDVRITLVGEQQARPNPSGGNHSSTSGYRGPLANARLGVQSSPTSVRAEKTILDTRAVHAQFNTKMARVTAMPRGRLRPLDRASHSMPRQESTSSDAQSSK